MTPSGIEPATFRFVAQHLNHCTTAVPTKKQRINIIYRKYICYPAILSVPNAVTFRTLPIIYVYTIPGYKLWVSINCICNRI